MNILPETEALLRRSYDAFNQRDIDTALATMDPNVNWPNMIEGTRVIGNDNLRAYCLTQFDVIDPHVEPVAFSDEDESIAVEVHQVLRDKRTGAVVADQTVFHIYELHQGLVAAMDVRDTEGTVTSAPRSKA